MSLIFEERQKNSESVISTIGQTIVDVITIPFDFVSDVVKTPFDFVGKGISGISTKIVLIVALGVAALFIIGKSNILKDVGSLR
jgi:hypothetical protein